MSTQQFQKDDIIVDYHGKYPTTTRVEEYLAEDGVSSEYVLVVAGPPKRIIDATNEVCEEHTSNRCLGRLANHVTQKTNNVEANMMSTEVTIYANEPPIRVAVFKARRVIQPFEHLRYDYGDKIAQEMLTN